MKNKNFLKNFTQERIARLVQYLVKMTVAIMDGVKQENVYAIKISSQKIAVREDYLAITMGILMRQVTPVPVSRIIMV
jgi:membrane protein YdbS with pleckstrin-like domain